MRIKKLIEVNRKRDWIGEAGVDLNLKEVYIISKKVSLKAQIKKRRKMKILMVLKLGRKKGKLRIFMIKKIINKIFFYEKGDK